MVRLLRDYLMPSYTSVQSFQSHNGAIAAEALHEALRELFSFNPTMVRLLLAASNGRMLRSWRFQSHNGAIAAF